MGWCRSRVAVAMIGVTGLAALLAGCGDDGSGESGGTPTAEADEPTTTALSEATSTTATTTFAQADDPPELVNTGEDFDAIVRSFVAYGEWLSVHPDLARLDDFVRRDSAAWMQLEPAFTELVAQGWHTNGDTPGTVEEARVLERPGPELAIVYVVIQSPSFRIIDGDGSTVREVPAEPVTAWAYEVRREGGGPWLLENRTVVGAV